MFSWKSSETIDVTEALSEGITSLLKVCSRWAWILHSEELCHPGTHLPIRCVQIIQIKLTGWPSELKNIMIVRFNFRRIKLSVAKFTDHIEVRELCWGWCRYLTWHGLKALEVLTDTIQGECNQDLDKPKAITVQHDTTCLAWPWLDGFSDRMLGEAQRTSSLHI